jgi:hypothetical protein
MPVPTILHRALRDHDHVSRSRRDRMITSGAAVRLGRLVRLHAADLDLRVGITVAVGEPMIGRHAQPNVAQMTSATTTASVTATSTTSLRRFTRFWNGL